MSNKNDVSVLIITCDAYSDVWDYFFILFNKFWPDCPYSIYLGTNSKECNAVGVKTICIGEDVSWCDNLRVMLEKIPTQYVIIMLEDYFINKRINTDDVERTLEFAKMNKADCVRLRNSPVACRVVDKNLRIGYAEPASPYYINAQPAIWKVTSLISLLKPNWSAWQFERENSKISKMLDLNIYTTNYQLVSCLNGVVRGKYLLSTIKALQRIGVYIDSSKREIYDDSSILNKIHPVRVSLKHYLHALFIKLKLYNTKLNKLFYR